jgi:hypothetical protein
MRTRLLVLVLVAIGSCQAPVSTKPTKAEHTSYQPTEEPREKIEGAAEVGSFAGEWRVAGVDGRSLDESTGLALRANDQEMWWEPRCAGMARRYRIDGQRVSFTSAGPPRAKGAATPPVCAIGLPPKLKEVFEALDDAATVDRTPNNGLRFASQSHSVTLFSP